MGRVQFSILTPGSSLVSFLLDSIFEGTGPSRQKNQTRKTHEFSIGRPFPDTNDTGMFHCPCWTGEQLGTNTTVVHIRIKSSLRAEETSTEQTFFCSVVLGDLAAAASWMHNLGVSTPLPVFSFAPFPSVHNIYFYESTLIEHLNKGTMKI